MFERELLKKLLRLEAQHDGGGVPIWWDRSDVFSEAELAHLVDVWREAQLETDN